MARPEVDFNKKRELSILKTGDKVELKDGEEVEFVRLKQKNFLGIMNGQAYNIPINFFSKVLEKKEDSFVKMVTYSSMEKGEPFYINTNGKDALLFTYECIEKGKIIGINPVTKQRTKIDTSLFAGRVTDL